MIKTPPAVQETVVRSLGREDGLEEEMVTLSSSLAWRIPWTEEPGGLQTMGLQRTGHDWVHSRKAHTPGDPGEQGRPGEPAHLWRALLNQPERAQCSGAGVWPSLP